MINGTLSKVLIFVAGAAAGSFVTWKLLDNKYKKQVEEELEEIRGYYSDSEDDYEDEEEEYPEFADEVREEYNDVVKKYGYTEETPEEEENPEDQFIIQATEPYTISPDDYGEYEDYEKIELTYYADGILADHLNEPIEDIDETVGNEWLESFGEWVDDVIHVRNDERKMDFEITQDPRPHADVIKYYQIKEE